MRELLVHRERKKQQRKMRDTHGRTEATGYLDSVGKGGAADGRER